MRLSEVSRGFSFPWGMAFLPDGRLLVTERAGRRPVVDTIGRKTEILGIPPMPYVEQAGLLDVALDPRFAVNGLLSDLGERLRDVEVAPDGALFLLTDSGRLLRYGP